MTKVCNWKVVDSNSTIQIYEDRPIRSITKLLKLLKEEYEVEMDSVDVEWYDTDDCGYIFQRGE